MGRRQMAFEVECWFCCSRRSAAPRRRLRFPSRAGASGSRHLPWALPRILPTQPKTKRPGGGSWRAGRVTGGVCSKGANSCRAAMGNRAADFSPSGRVADLYGHLFALSREGSLDLICLRRMHGIEHPADHPLVDSKAACQLGVIDFPGAYRQVERQLRREPKRHRPQALTTLRPCGRWDFSPAGQADRKIRPEGIHGFFHCLMIVFAVGRDAWKIDELDQYAAVATGRESCGIRKGGHWFTSHRSCGSIFRSRHVFANSPFPYRPRTGKRPACAAPASVFAARIRRPSRFHSRTDVSARQVENLAYALQRNGGAGASGREIEDVWGTRLGGTTGSILRQSVDHWRGQSSKLPSSSSLT